MIRSWGSRLLNRLVSLEQCTRQPSLQFDEATFSLLLLGFNLISKTSQAIMACLMCHRMLELKLLHEFIDKHHIKYWNYQELGLHSNIQLRGIRFGVKIACMAFTTSGWSTNEQEVGSYMLHLSSNQVHIYLMFILCCE